MNWNSSNQGSSVWLYMLFGGGEQKCAQNSDEETSSKRQLGDTKRQG